MERMVQPHCTDALFAAELKEVVQEVHVGQVYRILDTIPSPDINGQLNDVLKGSE